MSAYQSVELLEDALCEYSGSKYAVAVNSCTMAIFLCLMAGPPPNGKAASFPRRTYVSPVMSAIQAAYRIEWRDEDWNGAYQIGGTNVWDSARRFTSGMYRAGQFQCVSFHTSKILGIEQGGAILHDDGGADIWLRRARFHGRLNAAEKTPQQIGWAGYMSASVATLTHSRLACLPRDNPDQAGAKDFPDISGLPIWG